MTDYSDLYCDKCGNDDIGNFEYDDNFGGRLHYTCKTCGAKVIAKEAEDCDKV